MTTNVQPGGLVRETLIGPAAPPVWQASLVRETLYQQPAPTFYAAGLVRETLMSGFAVVRVAVFM